MPENASEAKADRRVRADAQRNIDALLAAAKAVFARSGVDAPVREIAAEAGVGVGTLYRHFPQRADLIMAVYRSEVDACAEAARTLAAAYPPGEALERWLPRLLDFVGTKRGLLAALQAGGEGVPANYLGSGPGPRLQLQPALAGLLQAAAEAGEIRADVDAAELLLAIVRLAEPDGKGGVTEQSRRMVGVLMDGLWRGAGPRT